MAACANGSPRERAHLYSIGGMVRNQATRALRFCSVILLTGIWEVSSVSGQAKPLGLARPGSTRQFRASTNLPEQASIVANKDDNCIFLLFGARFGCHHARERTGGPPCAGVS